MRRWPVDITDDLDVIENSLRMLPAWSVDDLRPEDQPINIGPPGQPRYVYFDPGTWWERFAELSGDSHRYLHEKLAGIMPELRAGQPSAAAYLLMFFDNPAVHEHLDVVAGHWETKVPGRIGQRWAETLCAAAWRVLLASESPMRPDYHFTLIPGPAAEQIAVSAQPSAWSASASSASETGQIDR